jgi:glycerol-3-phosphate dehydrogenase
MRWIPPTTYHAISSNFDTDNDTRAPQIIDGLKSPLTSLAVRYGAKADLAFLATARLHGAVVRTYAEVVEFISSGKTETVGAELVVNAAGPWAGPLRPWRA